MPRRFVDLSIYLENDVLSDRPAFQAGLRPGDVIFGVNRRRVASVEELAKSLGGHERAALNVVRGDFVPTVPLR